MNDSLLPFAAICLLYASASSGIAAEPRPNIVLIIADDLGYGDVGCYNDQSKIPTPHLDRLAAQGIRFTDAHSSSGVCVPSRFSLLTGRHAMHLVGGGNQATRPLIPEGWTTLPSMLAGAGYETSMIGKWHLGFDDVLKRPTEPLRGGPLDRGFAHYYGIPASLDTEPYLFIEGNRIVAQATDVMPGHASSGWPDDRMGEFWHAGKAAPGFRHADVLPELTARSERELHRLAKQSARQPFFFYYAMPSPHSPLLPSAEFRGRTSIGIYGDYVAQTDAAVGRLLQVLEETYTANDTIVFFSSDNGPFWYPENVRATGHAAAGRLRGMKGDAWEGGHRVPLIVRGPKIAGNGTMCDALVLLTDLTATIAALLDLQGVEISSEGADFSPALLARPWARPAAQPLLVRSSQGAHTIRDGSWKLIDRLGSGGFSKPQQEKPKPGEPNMQLYDLSSDPGETKNLVHVEPQRAAELQRRLAERLAPSKPTK